MSFQALSSDHRQIRVCPNCDLVVQKAPIAPDSSAYCPQCSTQLYRGRKVNIQTNLALALTCLLLIYPAFFHPFLSIRLIGEMITASLWYGVIELTKEGYLSLALLVFATTMLTPVVVLGATLWSSLAVICGSTRGLKFSLQTIHYFKHWMMLDVFLISIAISAFKLQDYSDLHFRPGLWFLAALQLILLYLISRISSRRYWEEVKPDTYPQPKSVLNDDFAQPPARLINCNHCHLPQHQYGQCSRCGSVVAPHNYRRMLYSTWGFLLVATIAIIPANLVPISILFTNGERLEDTIWSGIVSLVDNGMPAIALIIFVASIVVPITKILGIAYLLLAVQFDRKKRHRFRMKVYFVVKWIGKWSMMDILVISIMLSLVDRGHILNFTPGFGAIAFGVVVVFTMFATEALSPSFIWLNTKNKEH